MSQQTTVRLGTKVLAVWSVGFLIGTATHLLDLVGGGFETYSEFPTELRLFWVSLTIFNPITIILLVLQRRAGIILALVVMSADIAVNWTVFATIGGHPLFAVVSQTLFAAILLTTTPILWRHFSSSINVTAHRQRLWHQR